MRVTPESVNDRFVRELELEIPFQPPLAEKLERHLVDFGRLAVHERHIQKCLLLGAQGAMRICGDGPLRQAVLSTRV